MNSGSRWWHSENVDHVAKTLRVRGRGGQDLVMLMASVGKGVKPDNGNTPGRSHHVTGFMAWHIISHSGNGERFLGMLRCVVCTFKWTLDRDNLSRSFLHSWAPPHGDMALVCETEASDRYSPMCVRSVVSPARCHMSYTRLERDTSALQSHLIDR
jgi:hypothetical protein